MNEIFVWVKVQEEAKLTSLYTPAVGLLNWLDMKTCANSTLRITSCHGTCYKQHELARIVSECAPGYG